MPSPKTQPARGMRDFLPEDVRKREYVIGVIKEVYERYGFEPLETPAAENIETLTGKYGEEGNQLIFKILKRGVHAGTGEADLALRYDLTVPLARVVAEYRDKLPKFFKRYQIQPVWRADRPARGRFREFYQCDVDVVGSRSMLVEAELCAATSDVLEHLGFQDFKIRLNHRELLSAILEISGIPEEARNGTLVVLDKLDKLGKEGVRAELEAIGISGKQIMDVMLLTFEDVYAAGLIAEYDEPTGETYNQELCKRLRARLNASPRALEALTQIEQILDFSSATSASNHIEVDLSLVRGLSYYTGAIMEIKVPALSGSLGGGGRYNELIGMFLGSEVPACGFSLGLERIIVVMTEQKMFPLAVSSPTAEVMVTVSDNTRRAGIESLALANELRRCGIRTDLYPARDAKLGIQYKYGTNRGIRLAVTIGDQERAQKDVLIRDLRTRQDITVKHEDLPATLRQLLEGY